MSGPGLLDRRSAGGSPGGPAEPEARALDVARRGLTGGIVAYNEESTVEEAIGSLLAQRLPGDAEWDRIWVVASGCTDRTEDRVRALSAQHPKVRLISQPRREGKSKAIDLVFQRAQGRDLVLLNADATAEPGAVEELLRVAAGRRRPYAVMGRPVVGRTDDARVARLMRLQWGLHHELHRELIEGGDGNHLSDELLLVSLPEVPGIPPGIVNDGSYFGAWLARVGGEIGYAAQARVRVAIPRGLSDHVAQRRRIRSGHRQVAEAFGRAPATLPEYARREPGAAYRLVERALAEHDGGRGDLFLLSVAEAGAVALSGWDRLRGAPDPTHWDRIRTVGPSRAVLPAEPVSSGTMVVERRIRGLLDVAAMFGTGVPLGELVELLPVPASTTPRNVEEIRSWLEERPQLARLVGDRAYAPGATISPDTDRTARGDSYARGAQEILDRTLRTLRPLVVFAGLTGSAAYGEPELGDDLDFFVTTRSGAVWAFLAYTYLMLRLRPPFSPKEGRWKPCFNTVLEEGEAARDFARPGDLLFAREALGVRPLLGQTSYRRLLRRAGWIGKEFPRQYAERTAGPVGPAPTPAPLAVRILNAAIFPWLAAYLQLRGLERNRAARRAGEDPGTEFRTVSRPGRLTLSSRKFERVRELLGGLGGAAPEGRTERPAPTAPTGAAWSLEDAVGRPLGASTSWSEPWEPRELPGASQGSSPGWSARR